MNFNMMYIHTCFELDKELEISLFLVCLEMKFP